MPWPAPGSPAACHTWAVVHRKTSPTRVLRSPRPFEHSPVQLAPGLPVVPNSADFFLTYSREKLGRVSLSGQSPGVVPRTCLKALPSRRDTCIALPQSYIKLEDVEQLGEPSVIS